MAEKKQLRPDMHIALKRLKRAAGGMVVGAAGGALIGSVVPGIGTVMGALVGGLSASGAVKTVDAADAYAERKRTHPHETRAARLVAALVVMEEDEEGE